MTDNNKGDLGVLVMLLLAGVFALANLMMALIPGLALFEIADLPFAFLPDKHGDYWEKAGIFYGTAWSFLMFGVYVAGANRQVPEKWKDDLNGTLVWCVVGLMAARERGREIGYYRTIAYEGIVRHARQELQIGRRYFFLPRLCMLQSRHSGLVNALAKREGGMRARVEGIWIA